MNCPPDIVTNWYHEMAAHIKNVDKNHMVSIGAEGFHAEESSFHSANPGNWGKGTGQDFYSLHTSKDVDYATSHAWVDNWGVDNEIGFLTTWITTHEAICQALGKPLVLEEFGKESYPNSSEIKQKRDPIFDFVFSQVEQRLSRGGGSNLRAAMVWEWSGYQRPNELGNWLDEGDSTFTTIIIPHGERLKSMMGAGGAPVDGCVPVSSSLPTSPPIEVVAFNGTVETAGNRKLLWGGGQY